MAVKRLTIPLDERACTLALGPAMKPATYFRSAAAALTMIIDPEGPFCSRARDNIQNALRVSAITCAPRPDMNDI
jgi:hypothetical protein